MRRIHHRTANLIFGIGLLLLILFQFWFPILDTGNNYDTRSTAARGKKAFFLLMEQQDFDIYRSDVSLPATVAQLYDYETLVLLGPARLPSDFQWSQILEWVGNGGTLFFAASYEKPEMTIPEIGISVVRDDAAQDEAETEDADSSTEVKEEESGSDSSLNQYRKLRFCRAFKSNLYESDKIAWARGSSLSLTGNAARTSTPLVECDNGLQAAQIQHYRGRVIVLANDALFTNQSLMNEENAILATRLLERSIQYNNEYATVCVEEWLSTTAIPKVVGLLLTYPFRNVTLLVLGIGWVFAWWKWFRFGPYQPEEESHRLNIVSHTDTVGTLYYQERLGRYALEAYWKQFQKELNWSTHKQHRKRVISRIARRTQKTDEEITALFNRTLDGIDNPNLLRADAAVLIRDLARLRATIFA